MKSRYFYFFAWLGIFAFANAHQPLKILFVVQQFPAMDTFVVNQAQGLAQLGHAISVLALKHKVDDAPCELEPGIIQDVFYGRTIPKGISYDVILCQFLPLARIGLELVEAGLKAKLVVLVRGGSDNLLETHTKETNAFHTKLCKEVDLILPMCQFFHRQLLQLGYPHEKIKLLYSGVDLAQFSYTQRFLAKGQTIELLSIGHLIERKGFEFAIRAVAQVVKKFPQVHYTIIGKGALRDKLKLLIDQLGVARHVTLAGAKKHVEVMEYFNNAHIFLAPSVLAYGFGESIPTVLREAMASGMSVIATAHCGIPELVTDSRSGFLVPERNSHAVADRIEFLIRNPQLWNSLGFAARQAIEAGHGLDEEIQRLNNALCELTEVA